MGGLARKIPITFATFAIATAAIAGIPPLAGFFSKDEILWFAFASSRGGSPLLFAVAAVTALLTSFYMFRLLWLTFFGTSRMDAEDRASRARVAAVDDRRAGRAGRALGGRRLPRRAALPRAAAAAAEVRPDARTLRDARSRRLGRDRARGASPARRSSFGRGASARGPRCARASPALHRLLSGKYFVDELYERLIGRPLFWISDRVFLRLGDRVPPRRLAERHRAARAGAPRACSPACRPATCSSTPSSCSPGIVAVARLELPPWLTRPCSTSCSVPAGVRRSLLLLARARAAGTARSARLSLGVMVAQFALTACSTHVSTPRRPGLQFETRLPVDPRPGACTTRSASTATTCCWCC